MPSGGAVVDAHTHLGSRFMTPPADRPIADLMTVC